MIKVVTWNCNSISARFHILQHLVQDQNPDIICLQETKISDKNFPLMEINGLGFSHVYTWGENHHYGVAILSKIPLSEVSKIDPLDYKHPRHISAVLPIKCGGKKVVLHNFYVPSGGYEADIVKNPKFDHKLKFMQWMIDFFAHASKNEASIIVGDLNIAPFEHDVYDSKKLKNDVSHTWIERTLFTDLMRQGNLVDPFRLEDMASKIYTWWSYRIIGAVEKGYGRKLDHCLISYDLLPCVIEKEILANYRLMPKPSDHVPVCVIFRNLQGN